MGLDEKGRLSLGPQSQVKKLHFERGGMWTVPQTLGGTFGPK